MTKLAPKEVARWLSRQPVTAGVLVHGEDRGAVGEIAAQIGRSVVPDLADPFAVSLLEADSLRQDPARLADELASFPPLGGRRLVRLRDAADRHTALIERALDLEEAPRSDRLLVVEAGALVFRSSLRRLFETHSRLTGICCEPDNAAGQEIFLKQALADENLKADADTLTLLGQRIGSDRALARRAVENLALFKAGSAERTVDAALVRLVVGEAELWAFDSVIDALLLGELSAIDLALAQAFAANTAPVGILRALLRGMQRLHLLSAQMARGMGAEAALNALLPPVPYSARASYIAAARRWAPAVLGAILERLEETEILCKTTGIPEDVACAQALLTLPGLQRPKLRA